VNCLRVLCRSPPSFFFSSRRRHTRSKRDWSSDVCSSDLTHGHQVLQVFLRGLVQAAKHIVIIERATIGGHAVQRFGQGCEGLGRSEERRVGKAGGVRRAPPQRKQSRSRRRGRRSGQKAER